MKNILILVSMMIMFQAQAQNKPTDQNPTCTVNATEKNWLAQLKIVLCKNASEMRALLVKTMRLVNGQMVRPKRHILRNVFERQLVVKAMMTR